MKRRGLMASVGAVAIAGCSDFTTTDREAEAQPLDLDLDRKQVIGFSHDGQELGRFGTGTGAWVNVPYEFTVSTSSEDGVEWLWCTVEFTFPDADIRPPYIYLQGDTTVPIASFKRQNLTNEFTTLETREPVDGFDFDFRAQPLGSSEREVEEIPIELNFEGKLVDNGIRDVEYHAESSISSTLRRELV